MRGKKNREVNIFSASVVDLFASGLGVFLIVSIIALVNQKKTNQELPSVGIEGGTAVAGMEADSELEKKIKELEKQVMDLKIKNLKNGVVKKVSEQEMGHKVEMAALKSNFKRKENELRRQIRELKSKEKKTQEQMNELSKRVQHLNNMAKEGEQGVASSFNEFAVGTKIRLENVHFYPGTDRAIEPYASREIVAFAKAMKKNPNISIEVSGHIFETKKSIQDGRAEDEYNLSGRRANYVCNKFYEFGISLKRLRCVGYGATRSIVLTNDQYSEDAQKNRRVEIEILSK